MIELDFIIRTTTRILSSMMPMTIAAAPFLDLELQKLKKQWESQPALEMMYTTHPTPPDTQLLYLICQAKQKATKYYTVPLSPPFSSMMILIVQPWRSAL